MALQVTSHADALLRRIAGPSGLLADRYRPVEVLGQGGMGVVFHAIDERLGRDVAIKSLRPDLASSDFVARFAAEATALARIHHPNVVQILDVSELGSGTAYYVMELVRGTPLSQLLRERGSLPWSQAYDVLTQVASALAAVHKAGVVHRDLKPSNILCAEIGRESWHVELIDFGIAIAPGSPRLTRPGEVLGTLPYMAPEQFAGITIDRRTDVYGWGVLALELLGGVPPAELFGNESLAGKPLRDAAPQVLERARVRPHITAIVRRCLETQPDDRWPDMESVHAELSDRDDGGAPTLIFMRTVPLAKGGTVVPGDLASQPPTQHEDTLAEHADEAQTSVRERVDPNPPTVIDSGIERAPAQTGGTVPMPVMTMPVLEPEPRSRAPMRLAIAALVVSILGSAAWVAHAYGWLERGRCARVQAAMRGWPILDPPRSIAPTTIAPPAEPPRPPASDPAPAIAPAIEPAPAPAIERSEDQDTSAPRPAPTRTRKAGDVKPVEPVERPPVADPFADVDPSPAPTPPPTPRPARDPNLKDPFTPPSG
jgi:serine/threonine protein kinase